MTFLSTKSLAAALVAMSVSGIQAADQKTFKTPSAAAHALVAAAQKGAREEVVSILGEEIRPALTSGSPSQDQIEKAVMLELAAEAVVTKPDGGKPERMIMYLGTDPWPFPVPLVKSASGWRFDAKAGLEEIENRALGRNELGAIVACLAYVDAQVEYASEDRTGEGILQFAQKVRSSSGKHDGLFWTNDKGEDPSPLGPFAADSAAAEGSERAPFFGYYYRILTAQGSNAAGGARDFLVDGHLLGGFGLVAWPAEYGVTGVETFIVNQLGDVYEKDLGANTNDAVKAIIRFDPDPSWRKIE
jgi:hypothetical protein